MVRIKCEHCEQWTNARFISTVDADWVIKWINDRRGAWKGI